MDRYEVMAGKMAPLTDGAHRNKEPKEKAKLQIAPGHLP